jgi:hypothetical protein
MIGSMKAWRGLAAGLISVASLVVVVPATAAEARPDDRAGALGPGAQRLALTAVRPDDRVGVRGAIASPPVLHPVSATSGAFDWDVAAAGAAVTLGVISLAGIGVLASRRRGRLARPAVTTPEGRAS